MKKRNSFALSFLSAVLASTMFLSGCSSARAKSKDDASEHSESDKLKAMIADLNTGDAEAVAEAFALYDLLPFEEKCRLTYAEYEKLRDAEYELVNGERIADADKHKPEIIAAVARAYFNQSYQTWKFPTIKPQTQYDQYNSRRNVNATPEDATAQRTLYLDCSSFVNSVYYYTFGRNLLDPGKSVTTKNIDTEMSSKPTGLNQELLFYFSGSKLATLKSDAAAAEKQIAEIKKALQPGDVINYYRADSGHVVMYLGDGKIIHSTGSANAKTTSGNVDPKTSLEKATSDEARFGTVFVDDWDRFFTTKVTPASQKDGRTGTGNSYLFGSTTTAIAIFRPAADKVGRMSKSKLTTHAISRYLYDGLNIEKESTVQRDGKSKPLYYGSSVRAGEEITFTVMVVNTSNGPMSAVNVEEKIPAGLEFVSASEGGAYFADNNTVCFHLSTMKAGQKVKVSYVLKVKEGLDGGKTVEDSQTLVNGIRTNKLIYQVADGQIDGEKFGSAIESLLGKTYDNGVKAAAAVYEAAGLGGSEGAKLLTSIASPKNVFSKYFVSNLLKLGDKDVGLVCRLYYGGHKIGSAEVGQANDTLKYDNSNLRVRRVMEEYLENGDVICTYTSFGEAYAALLYYDGDLYTTDKSGKLNIAKPVMISSGSTVQDYLDTLTAYNQFIILRPALLG